MPKQDTRRTTIYLEADLYHTLRAKIGVSSSTISQLINDALKETFKEDMRDIQAIKDAKSEPSYSLESVLLEFNLST